MKGPIPGGNLRGVAILAVKYRRVRRAARTAIEGGELMLGRVHGVLNESNEKSAGGRHDRVRAEREVDCEAYTIAVGINPPNRMQHNDRNGSRRGCVSCPCPVYADLREMSAIVNSTVALGSRPSWALVN